MKEKLFYPYSEPTLTVIEISTEYGFALSGFENNDNAWDSAGGLDSSSNDWD